MGIINQQYSLENAKPVITFGAKDEGKPTIDAEDPLDFGQATKYRALVARCNHVSPDRPNIAFAVKELARNMSAPRKRRLGALKKNWKVLAGHSQVVQARS